MKPNCRIGKIKFKSGGEIKPLYTSESKSCQEVMNLVHNLLRDCRENECLSISVQAMFDEQTYTDSVVTAKGTFSGQMGLLKRSESRMMEMWDSV